MKQTMHTRQKNLIQGVLSILLLAVALGSFGVVANAQARAKDEAASVEPAGIKTGLFDLTGTWELTITPDDGSPAFVGFYSFGADGNVSFSSAGPPIPGLGNPGYGVWKKIKHNRFAVTFKMISYTLGFQFDGTLKVLADIQMTSENTFVTSDTIIIYDPEGNEIVRLAGSAQGRRMTVENVPKK